jgi:hypothetical protein
MTPGAAGLSCQVVAMRPCYARPKSRHMLLSGAKSRESPPPDSVRSARLGSARLGSAWLGFAKRGLGLSSGSTLMWPWQVMYSALDRMALESIVGSSRSARMLTSDKPAFLLV